MRIFLNTTLSSLKVYAVTTVSVPFHFFHFTKSLELDNSLYFWTHRFQCPHPSSHVFLCTLLDYADGRYRFYGIFGSHTFTSTIQDFGIQSSKMKLVPNHSLLEVVLITFFSLQVIQCLNFPLADFSRGKQLLQLPVVYSAWKKI